MKLYGTYGRCIILMAVFLAGKRYVFFSCLFSHTLSRFVPGIIEQHYFPSIIYSACVFFHWDSPLSQLQLQYCATWLNSDYSNITTCLYCPLLLFEIRVIFYGYRDTRDGGVLINILSREAACCPKTGKFLPYCTSRHDTSLLYIVMSQAADPQMCLELYWLYQGPSFPNFSEKIADEVLSDTANVLYPSLSYFTNYHDLTLHT